ncbi:HEAT repeat domain-containing protein [Vibrio kyushuensis]|uniref:HEAT repeat domain-containing protein n=1 Tax=Vibrio kyushuensis TaxID=2910249 RepID=UPI003D1091C7
MRMHDVELKEVEIEAANQKSQSLLIELLASGDEAQKCYSARAIGQSQIAAADAELNKSLYHADPDVVVDCVNALAQLNSGDVAALEDVARNHPEGDARLAALNALSHHFSNASVRVLFEDFALGRQQNDQWGLASDWDDWWDIQIKAVSVLVEHATKNSLPLLKQILDLDPEPELEALIYNGIAKLDPNWIIEELENAPLMKKRKLLKSLNHSNTQIARAFLYKHLRDNDAVIRKTSIAALANKQASEYFWDIVKCLQDDSTLVQQQAILALDSFSQVDNLDTGRLIGYLENASSNAYPELLKLCLNQQLSVNDIDRIVEKANSSNPHSLTALLSHWDSITFNSQHKGTLLDCLITHLADLRAETHVQIQLIRQLPLFQDHEERSLTLLEKFIHREDEQNGHPFYESSIRQACFDTLSHSAHPSCEHMLKTTLFGAQAYPNAIDINVVDDKQESETSSAEEAQQAELAALLDEHNEKFAEPMSNTNSPSSTLGMIQQANVESVLVQPNQSSDKKHEDQQKNIVEMVEELDGDLENYANIVKAHFDSAEHLDMNRRKIAKLPNLDNRLIGVKALGQSHHPLATRWLVESILGAEPNEMREIFQALTLQKKRNKKDKQIDNGIGAAGNAIHHGDPLLKQAAGHFLSTMPTSKAIPLLLVGLNDDNEHVRLTCLNSLELHLDKIKLTHRDEVKIAIYKALQDPAGGVRKQALRLCCLRLKDEIITPEQLEPLLNLALNDEESHSVANTMFKRFKLPILMLINQKLMTLADQRQPNAIKLLGEMLT